jgi:hypothetical protein
MVREKKRQPRTSPSSDSLSGRVRALIDERDGGSTNRAAEHIGMHQSTLWRLLDGRRTTTENVRAIAHYYGVSSGWLLDGVGKGPPQTPSTGVFAATQAGTSNESRLWAAVLEDLEHHGLSARGGAAWGRWPANEALYAAAGLVDLGLTEESQGASVETRQRLDRGLAEWIDAHYSAARGFLGHLLHIFGPDQVGAKLEALQGYATLGFDRRALYMAMAESSDSDAAELIAMMKASVRLPYVPPLRDPLPAARDEPSRNGDSVPTVPKRKRVGSVKKRR